MQKVRGGFSFRNCVLLIAVLFCTACSAVNSSYLPLAEFDRAELVLPSEATLPVLIADTPEKQQQGLSGVRESDWPEGQGMLFVYDEEAPHQFWMVDTYFDLDIFFLDADFRVTHIERDMLAHPGRKEPPEIARTELIKAQYVLEMKSSFFSSKILLQDRLEWKK